MTTPLEMKEKRFRAGWSGFNKKEVIDFLDLLSSEFQVNLKENRKLQQQLEEEKGKQKELLKRESLIKSVLVKAQDNSEKIRQDAEREAELMLKETELKVEKMLAEAHQGENHILRQVEDLKVTYKQLKVKMQSTLEMYSKLLADDDVI